MLILGKSHSRVWIETRFRPPHTASVCARSCLTPPSARLVSQVGPQPSLSLGGLAAIPVWVVCCGKVGRLRPGSLTMRGRLRQVSHLTDCICCYLQWCTIPLALKHSIDFLVKCPTLSGWRHIWHQKPSRVLHISNQPQSATACQSNTVLTSSCSYFVQTGVVSVNLYSYHLLAAPHTLASLTQSEKLVTSVQFSLLCWL